MKTFSSLIAVTLLGLSATAGAQIKMPDPMAPGGSYETAVRLVVMNDMMIERSITRWMRTHYPGWNYEPHELQEMADERYAIVYATAPNNPGRRVYFRIFGTHRDSTRDGGFPL